MPCLSINELSPLDTLKSVIIPRNTIIIIIANNFRSILRIEEIPLNSSVEYLIEVQP